MSDQDAILTRRAFLIQSALASSVLGTLANACDSAENLWERRPQRCLSLREPPPKLPKDLTALHGPYWSQIDTSGLPRKGPENAPVQIVVFGEVSLWDMRSWRVYAVINRAVKAYPSSVSIHFAHFPESVDCSDPEDDEAKRSMACDIAGALVCAQEQQGSEGFFRMLEAFSGAFDRSRLGKEKIPEEAEELILLLAKKHGLNGQEILACMRKPEALERIQQQAAMGRNLGVTEAPTWFINGYLRTGIPRGSFHLQIDKLIEYHQADAQGL